MWLSSGASLKRKRSVNSGSEPAVSARPERSTIIGAEPEEDCRLHSELLLDVLDGFPSYTYPASVRLIVPWGLKYHHTFIFALGVKKPLVN